MQIEVPVQFLALKILVQKIFGDSTLRSSFGRSKIKIAYNLKNQGKGLVKFFALFEIIIYLFIKLQLLQQQYTDVEKYCKNIVIMSTDPTHDLS